MKAGLLICPFGQRLLYGGMSATLAFEAKWDLFPPYRLYLGNVRSDLVVRKMMFDGENFSASKLGGLYAMGPEAVGGEIFGLQLLPFWAPPCPVGRRVELEIESANAAPMSIVATLLASPRAEDELISSVAASGSPEPKQQAGSSYWR